jgi:hypothetical protein
MIEYYNNIDKSDLLQNFYIKEYSKKNETDKCTIDDKDYIEWLESKVIELAKIINSEFSGDILK